MKPVRRRAARAALPEQLDKALETIMSDRKARLPRINSRLAGILRVAADLRDLPSVDFKARLREELASSGSAASRREGEATFKPEGFHSVTPYLQVKRASRFIEFLRSAFGAAEVLRVRRDDGTITHAQMQIEGSMLELADATEAFPPNPTALWLFVGDADKVYNRARRAGAVSIHEPTDQDYGDREASVRDPFGNHWYIATHRADAEPLPAELRSVTPYLHPIGSRQLIEFMKKAFDAEEVFRAQDESGMVHHAKIRIGDSIIAMGEAHGPYQPMPPTLHLYVNDTDLHYRRAIDAGATSISEPADQSYGDRGAGVKDPFGNVWYIATHKKALPAQEEVLAAETTARRRPGTIMPFMYVDDPAGAFDFYRKVFGAVQVHRVVQPNGRVSHLQMAIGETNVMLRDANTPDLAEYRAKGFAATPHSLGGTPLHLYLYVDDADAAYQRAIDSGSQVTDPMADQDWGDRCGGVQDPFGHIWYIATPLRTEH